MEAYPTCPHCKTKNDATTIFLCKENIGGCGRLFCRDCCGGYTTVRCPICQEPEFTGPVVAVGWVARKETDDLKNDRRSAGPHAVAPAIDSGVWYTP
jgi:hypothetical protein